MRCSMNVKGLATIRNISSMTVMFGIVLLCYLWGELYYQVQNERQVELNNAVKSAENYTRTFSEHTVRTIRGLDAIALFLKYQAEEYGLAIDLLRLVKERRFEGQPFIALALIDENGELIAGSQNPFAKINISDLEAFQVHKGEDSGKLFIGKPFLEQASGKWIIQMTRRINKANGSFGGVAVIGVDPYYFAEFYKQVDLGENSVIALIGLDGIMRVRQSGDVVRVGIDFTRRMNEFSHTAGNYFHLGIVDGINRYYSYRKIQEYPLIVTVGVTESQVFGSLNQRLVGYYWMHGVMSTVILIFVGSLLSSAKRRKKAEEALQESEERFRKLSENARDMLFHMSLPEGKYDYVSPASFQITGYTPEELISGDVHISQCIHPDFHGFFQQAWKDLQQGKAPIFYEYKIIRKDGQEAWLFQSNVLVRDEHGLPVALEGIVHDITERKRAEETVRASQARYRALMEQSCEALALVDIQTQEVIEINRRFTELLGYSLPEDSPLYVQQCVVESQQNIYRYFNDTLKQQRILPTATRVFHHKNGMEVTVESAATVITIGERQYLLVSNRDMTEEHRRQAELTSEVEFARRVQRELLPEISESPYVTVSTIYYPSNVVSGDSYIMEWRNEGKLLRGFLIDITGHGLATALQTASINALLRETSTANLTLAEQLCQIDSRAAKYFSEGSFAAMIGFEIDLFNWELRYITAGITHFYANGREIVTPGMFVGIKKDAEFGAGMISISEGDCFHFLTDGFTDILEQPEYKNFWTPDGRDFYADVAALEHLAETGELRDDATGLCFRINGRIMQ